MFLKMTQERKKEIQLMLTNYDFTNQTIIKQIDQEITDLLREDYRISEICSILSVELGLDFKADTLQKILKRLSILEKIQVHDAEKKNEVNISTSDTGNNENFSENLMKDYTEFDMSKCPF